MAKLLDHLFQLRGPFNPQSLERQLVLEVYRRTDLSMYQRTWIDPERHVVRVRT